MTNARIYGARALDYGTGRPGYSPEVVSALSRGCSSGLDVGAGTGNLSSQIIATNGAMRMVLVDPDPRMLGVAPLAGAYPRVLAVASALPFRAGSFDVVVAGQSFHHFCDVRSLRECMRVLKPGGVLHVLTNLRVIENEWQARLSILVGVADEWGSVQYLTFRQALLDLCLRLGVTVEEATSPWFHTFSRDALLSYVLSRSTSHGLPQDDVQVRVGGIWQRSGAVGLLRTPFVTASLRISVS